MYFGVHFRKILTIAIAYRPELIIVLLSGMCLVGVTPDGDDITLIDCNAADVGFIEIRDESGLMCLFKVPIV
jgi:hypothetical protein